MREREEKQMDMDKETEEIREWGNIRMKTNTVKLEHHSSGLSRAQTPSDSAKKTGDQPWFQPGFVSLHRGNMAWNPIIPGYRDVRAPSSSLIPRHRGYGTTCTVYIEAHSLKKKRLSPILIGSRGSLVEGQIELEWRMDDTHSERQLHSQSSATLACKR